MARISEHIMELAKSSPEGTPLCASALLQFGTRAAVDRALSRLVRSGLLKRVCRGIYMRRFETPFGWRGPCTDTAVRALTDMWGETWVPCGGAAANWLGLITQNPIRRVYLSSGPNRRLNLGGLVESRHASRWRLVAPHSKAGTLIRALTFLHRDEAAEALEQVVPTLTGEERDDLEEARPLLPDWMAEAVNTGLAHA